MRFYGDMFRAFSALLPSQWADPLGRSARLFAAAWVGDLVLLGWCSGIGAAVPSR